MPATAEAKTKVRKKAVRRNPKMASKKAVKQPTAENVSEETNVVFGDVVELLVVKIKRNPYNRQPKKPDIEELAKSIELHGQLEPCLVRTDPFGGYELISGETRWLAHQHLKRKVVFCRVARCDDATALKLVAAANGARKDLDPIQRAELLQQLCLPVDKGGSGLTQQEAGKLVAEDGKPMSRSSVSNSIRLLSLPKKVSAAIASGRLAETYARSVLSLFDSPVAKQAEKEVVRLINSTGNDWNDLDGMTRKDFEEAVADKALDNCRDMRYEPSPNDWELKNPTRSHAKAYFKPSDQQRETLGVFTFDGTEYCVNVELWKQLQAEAAAKKKAGREKKASGKKGESTSVKAARRLEQIKSKVREWQLDLMRWWCSVEIDEPVAEELMLHVGAMELPLSEEVERMKLKLPKKDKYCEWAMIGALQTKTGWRTAVVRELLWPSDPDEAYHVRGILIHRCSERLGYDSGDAWMAAQEAGGDRLTKLLAEFYSIFSKDELSDLITNLKIKSPAIVDAKTKADMVEALSQAFIKTPPILKGK